MLLLGMRTVTGFGIVQWWATRPHEGWQHLAMLTRYVATGQLRSEIAAVVPLDEAPKAHERHCCVAGKGDRTKLLRAPHSDCVGQFGEGCGEPALEINVDAEFVVAAAQVLDERVLVALRS